MDQLQRIIPSYPYTQYADDDSIQAFIAAYNDFAQAYLDYFNNLQLPIYTRPEIYGLLLDWVAEGLYGFKRPLLPTAFIRSKGPYNTLQYNEVPYNYYLPDGPSEYFATSDDVFKRIITWNFFKGDGTQFNVRWLKRRVQRFLIGENGIDPPVDETYQISVLFSGTDWTIRILNGIRTVIGGAMYDRHGYNDVPYDSILSTFIQFAPIAMAPTFKAALDAGVLQLPFQFNFTVQI